MQPYGVQFCFGRRTEGVQGASGKPPASDEKSQLCHTRTPAEGLTRRLRRGRRGFRPDGGSTFFRSERKYQRKHAARRYGKKPFIAHFDGGARNVARRLVGEITHAIGRARAHSFPLSKRARLFPSAAYRRSAPPPLGWEAELKRRGLEYFIDTWLLL